MEVSSYSIDNQGEADDYLADLLERPEYRSMHEIEARAAKYVKDAQLRVYFIEKGRAMLGASTSTP